MAFHNMLRCVSALFRCRRILHMGKAGCKVEREHALYLWFSN